MGNSTVKAAMAGRTMPCGAACTALRLTVTVPTRAVPDPV